MELGHLVTTVACKQTLCLPLSLCVIIIQSFENSAVVSSFVIESKVDGMEKEEGGMGDLMLIDY